MENRSHLLEVYSDYLLYQHKQATATGLSQLSEGLISHDKITRFLSEMRFSSKNLWAYVKSYFKVSKDKKRGVLILDDTIEEKPHMKENPIVCWHYDHTKSRATKGINIVTSFFQNGEIGVPVGYEVVSKTVSYKDIKTGKTKRKSQETKNEKFRRLVVQADTNGVPFEHVLADSWYCSKENMNYVNELGKKFIFGIESNRLICFNNQEGTKKRHYLQLKKANLKADRPYSVMVKGIDYPLTLVKKVFKNGDGSIGILYLISNDLTLSGEALYKLYQRRWKIEEYHKSIKQNASLAKAQCWRETTQKTHIFATLIAFCKLELLKVRTNLNHYEIRHLILLKANLAGQQELNRLRTLAA